MSSRSVAPARSAFACPDCGYVSPKWFGRCPDCGAWGNAGEAGRNEAPVLVTTLAGGGPPVERFGSGIAEVDRVLGGGLVPGAVALLAGEPGVGKSTIVLQVLDGVGGDGRRTLLVTGEESAAQVALRAQRLGLDRSRLRVAATCSLEETLAAARAEAPALLVVDSIQTVQSTNLDQVAGSVTQVRDGAAALIRFAKTTGTAVLLVGHVTKEGSVAGPKTLEHLVDVVVTLEGERSGTVRLLRAVKNRFGSCEETGVFVMEERGLQAVPDPSAMLLADRRPGVSGSVVFPGLEGSRPVLVEIQALVTPTTLPHPRRIAIGLDSRRLTLAAAVVAKRAREDLGGSDLFVAAAGGLTIKEPAADLAVALALFSAVEEVPVEAGVVAAGEVGLGGEVRRVPGMERRLFEAARLGFTTALIPRGIRRVPDGVHVLTVADIGAAFAAVKQMAANRRI
jgi:DNA repair protein RadA/Sms